LRGLHVPETGIVDYKAVAGRLARLAQDRGCTMKVGSRVVGFRNVAGRMVLQTHADEIQCKALGELRWFAVGSCGAIVRR
jgi:L-2-hydroxyglutarate oxidase LhgO